MSERCRLISAGGVEGVRDVRDAGFRSFVENALHATAIRVVDYNRYNKWELYT